MKTKVGVAILAASVVISIVFLAIFIPHFQREVEYSGGALELKFEDQTIQYVADGGRISVELGSKCSVKAITPTDSKNYSLSLREETLAENYTVTFDSLGVYIFDLRSSDGNYTAIFSVEVVA